MNQLRDLTISEFKPEPMLKRPSNVPENAKFPVIDAHNHLWGDASPEEMLAVMDQVGVKTFVNVTGNTVMKFVNNCYTIDRRDISVYADRYIKAHPGRFAALTMSDFAQWGDFVLIKDDTFTDKAILHLEEDVAKGASGLKLTKELGLRFTDATGRMIPIDDDRIDPLWKRAGELGVPVLIHVSDPVAFFMPINAKNEHYPTLMEFPDWAFQNTIYSKWHLLEQRDRMIAKNPKTTYLLPHVANNSEDLDSVSALLDRFPNVYIDFSARIDELGRQPYTARDFMIKYQDRILFGIDMPVSPEIYRCYFRFLETRDEYFDYPDYIGRWGRTRWRIYGLHLPDEVLKKIYYRNACKIIPGLEACE